jgi:multiple sugar transport system substrate-binding protein
MPISFLGARARLGMSRIRRPWFVDVRMLYWRTDLMDAPPLTIDALHRLATRAVESGAPSWPGVAGRALRGLVTVFLEYLSAFGGGILDERGRVVVDSDAAIRAPLRCATKLRPVTSSHRPSCRGRKSRRASRFRMAGGVHAELACAYTLLEARGESQVVGRFGVTSMPAGEGGAPAAALGGSNLAINANSDRPGDAYALVDYLTQPEQMIERARAVGQFPARERLMKRHTRRRAEIDRRPRIRSSATRSSASDARVCRASEILQVAPPSRAARAGGTARRTLAAASAIRQILKRSGLDGGA